MKFSKSTNWKMYWGAMPLPAGAVALGTITRDTGETGALIRLPNNCLVQGNAGGIRTLPQRDVTNAIDRYQQFNRADYDPAFDVGPD